MADKLELEDDSNLEKSACPEHEKGDSIVELTPTNDETPLISESGCEGNPTYRLCISPSESEASSADTTPDAALLNKAPFEIKLVPKLSTKKTSPNTPEKDSVLNTSEAYFTPEKVVRPINFNNLSPRSVTYHFSSRYQSGLLRPRKVRKSYQNLLEECPADPSGSSKQERAKSDESLQKSNESNSESSSPPRKKRNHSTSLSEFRENNELTKGPKPQHIDGESDLAVNFKPLAIDCPKDPPIDSTGDIEMN